MGRFNILPVKVVRSRYGVCLSSFVFFYERKPKTSDHLPTLLFLYEALEIPNDSTWHNHISDVVLPSTPVVSRKCVFWSDRHRTCVRHRIGRMHMIYDRVNRLTWVADRHVQNHLCPVLRNMRLVWGRQIRLFIITHAQMISLVAGT